jgi:hypothetical protein
MKTTKKIILSLVFAMVIMGSPMNLLAQKDELDQQQKELDQQKQRLERQKEKIEAQRVAFITDKLDLTPAEAQVFWPVYNEYDKKRHEINKMFPKPSDKDIKPIEEMTDKEAMDIADGQLVEAQKMLELRKEYHGKFKNVLPPKKLLKLYDAERDFQRELIDRLRDGRGPGQGPGKGQGQGQGNQKRSGNRYGAPNK